MHIFQPNAGAADADELPKSMYWHATNSRLYNPLDGNGWRVFTSPFALAGRKAEERFIEFQWQNSPTLLQNGPYEIHLQARLDRRSDTWRTVARFDLHTELTTSDRGALLPRPNDPDWRE